MSGSRILVTGGYGFIGAWLARRLLTSGNHVTLVDSGPYQGSTAAALSLADHEHIQLVRGDLRYPETLGALGSSFDYIVHAAGVLGIKRVVAEPVSTLDVNIRGTHACLEFAAQQRSLQRIVLFSTSEVYGRDATDVREDDSARIDTDSIRWGYATSKLAAEFLGMAFHHEHDVPAVIVRPFNVYGPHRRGYNAMTTLVANALRGGDLIISGDGSQRRSWCFVTDLVDGVERCLLVSAAVGEAFNLGNDQTELSVLELAQLVVERTGSTSTITITGDDVPDVRFRRPVLTKARTLLDYHPSVGLNEGIKLVADATVNSGG